MTQEELEQLRMENERAEGEREGEMRAFVKGEVEKWLRVTGHGEWRVRCRFPRRAGEGGVDMRIVSSSVYLQAELSVYDGARVEWLNFGREGVGKMVLHEICHLFLRPVEEAYGGGERGREVVEAVERQVQRIANAIWRMRELL